MTTYRSAPRDPSIVREPRIPDGALARRARHAGIVVPTVGCERSKDGLTRWRSSVCLAAYQHAPVLEDAQARLDELVAEVGDEAAQDPWVGSALEVSCVQLAASRQMLAVALSAGDTTLEGQRALDLAMRLARQALVSEDIARERAADVHRRARAAERQRGATEVLVEGGPVRADGTRRRRK